MQWLLDGWGVAMASVVAVGPLATVLHRTRRELQNAHRALNEDELTGLANRRACTAYLEIARRTRRPVAVLLIDLDEFKSVNDRFGHLAGDQVLCEVGSRLRTLRMAVGLAARMSGDEFLVIVDDIVAARAVADHVWDVISSVPFAVGGGEFRLTTSIGVAIAADGEYDQLLPSADMAMYHAKTTRCGVATTDDMAAWVSTVDPPMEVEGA